MKLVNLKTFLTLPGGTVYQKYQPIYTECLSVKVENCGERDFILQSLDGCSMIDVPRQVEYITAADSLLQCSLEDGEEVKVDWKSSQRDGCFEDDQLFLIWSRKDIRGLQNVLDLALARQDFHGDKG